MAISECRCWQPARTPIGRGIVSLTTIFCLLLFHQIVAGQPQQLAADQNVSGVSDRYSIVVPECRITVVNEVSLACERSGVLDSITPQGALVKKGDVIAQIRDSIAQASYMIAERESSNDIEIRYAKKAGELAQLKYERAKKADRTLSGTVTEFELRELRLAAERSLLQLQQADQQFAIAQLKKQEQLEQLKSFQITAPFDAFVRIAQKKPGEFVQEGEVVLEIINDDMMRAEGFVSVEDLPSVAIGNDVTIYLQQPNRKPVTFRGNVNFVDTKIEPISMKVRISAHIQNVNSVLKDGFLVTMAIAPNNHAQLSHR